MGFLGSLLSPILGGVGGALQSRAASQAAKDQANLNNAFIGQSDKAKADLIASLKAAGYDPYGPQVSTTSSTGGGKSASRYGSKTHAVSNRTKTVLAENQAAENALRARIEGRLANKAGVSQGEILNQIANINRGSDAAARAVANKVAGTGVGGAQAGAAYTPGEMSRVSAINDFLASVPQLARSRQMEDEAAASGFLAQRAGEQDITDSDTSGWSNTDSSSFGNTRSTGGPDIGQLLALTSPTAPQQSLKTGTSAWGSALSGAAGAIPSDWLSQLKKPGGLSMPAGGIPAGALPGGQYYGR